MLNHSPVVQTSTPYGFVLAQNGSVALAAVKSIDNHILADGCQFRCKDTNDGSLREVAVFEFGTQTTESVCEPETRIEVEEMDRTVRKSKFRLDATAVQ